MRSSDWKRIVKPLLDDDWVLESRFVHLSPIGWVLHGVLWEASASGPGFYLWLLQMPLMVPTDVIDLSWSDRHGGSSRIYDEADESTGAAVAEAMNIVRAAAQKMTVFVDPPGGADNVRMQEARGYGLLLVGNPGGAFEVLGRVSQYQAKYPWEKELVVRAARMRSLIENDQVQEVLDHLNAWRTESLAALGIDAR